MRLSQQQLQQALAFEHIEAYAVLDVDVSASRDQANLADIATHYPSGDSFAFSEFTSILNITDLQHPVDYDLFFNDRSEDGVPFRDIGDGLAQFGALGIPISSIFLTTQGTSGTNVRLLLEGK